MAVLDRQPATTGDSRALPLSLPVDHAPLDWATVVAAARRAGLTTQRARLRFTKLTVRRFLLEAPATASLTFDEMLTIRTLLAVGNPPAAVAAAAGVDLVTVTWLALGVRVAAGASCEVAHG